MKDALGRHDAILRSAIEASGGQVVKTTGDGMMAVFGSAVDATTASLARRSSASCAEPWADTGPLRVRIGVHCGQAEERAATSSVRPSTGRPGSWPPGTAARSSCPSRPAALAREALPGGG